MKICISLFAAPRISAFTQEKTSNDSKHTTKITKILRVLLVDNFSNDVYTINL